jgi:hypothetical protein
VQVALQAVPVFGTLHCMTACTSGGTLLSKFVLTSHPPIAAMHAHHDAVLSVLHCQPLTPPTGLLIFKDITFKGFWVSGG